MKRIRSIVLVAVFATSAFGFLRGEAPNVQTGTWAPGPAMSVVRSGAASVLMPNGRVLVTGGMSGSDIVASTDVFDPFRGFAADAAMNNARADHAAVTLADGSVLAIGGRNAGGAVASAEIYAAGVWSEVGALTEPRWGHTATLLADGRVLVAGGESAAGLAASVEVFNPATAAFDLVGTLASPRKGHAAARLNDGRVLIAGGFDGQQVLSSIDVFDPIGGSFTAGPSLLTARAGLTATTLLDGKVLLFGGYDGTNELPSSEVVDSVAATVTAGPTAAFARRDHQAFRLPNNNSVLISGGVTGGAATASVELYVPGVNQFWPASAMSAPRASATGSPLTPESYGDPSSTDGLLLVGGGIGLSSSELFGFATIKADKDDYSPGQEMFVSGSGWQPGETVSFALRELPNEHDTRFFTVTADPVTGAVPRTKLFDVELHHLGVRFYLTAAGAASRAVTTFTDSNPQTITVAAPATVSVVPGSTAVYGTVTVTANGNSTACAVTLSTNSALPTGASAIFGTNPVSVVTAATSTFSIGTTAATPLGTTILKLAGSRGTGCGGSGTLLSNDVTLSVVAKRVGTVTVGSQIGTSTSGTAGSVTYTVTVTRNGPTGTAFTADLSVPTALPSGATSSFSSPGSTLSFAANDTSKTATLTINTTAVTPAGSTGFTVQASNPNVTGDSSTGTGTLTVSEACAAPSITGQPSSQSITYGDPATFTAAASGNPTPTVQWQVSTDAGANWTNLAGETATTLTLTRPTVAQSGNRYRAVFTNTCSGTQTATTTAAVLTVSQKSVVGSFTAANKTYDGDVTAGILTRTLTGQISGDDASLSGGSATFDTKNVGTGKTVTGTGFVLAGTTAGNYSLSSSTLTTLANVTERPVTVTAEEKSKTYGDSDPALTYQVTSGSLVSGDAFSGALSRATGEGVGTYAIQQGTLTAGANYNLTFVAANLTINTRPVTVTADPKTKVYGDGDPALTYQITSGSLAFSDAFSGALSRVSGENVGSYAIQQSTLTLGSNYNLTFVGANLTVTTRPVTVTADPRTKVYGDADPALTYQITSGSLAFSDAFSGALSRVSGENVGSYAIQQGTLTLGGNYNLTFVGANLTITARPVTVTADARTKVYGDADPALTYQVTSGSLVGEDVFTGSLSRDAGENVGSYAIHQGTLTLGSNYDLTFVGANLTVTTRPVTVTADAKTKVYGDADPALTYQVTSGSLAFSDAFSGTLSRAAGESVGTYTIQQGTLALGSNYDLTFVGANLTVTTRPVTVTADPRTKVYGDADPALTYQVTSGSLVGEDVFTGSLSRDAGENVGSYAIHQGTVTLGTNYNLTFVGANLTINKRAIAVAADAQTKVYGEADPPLTYQVTGTLAFSDTFSGTLARVAGENVGTYAIQQGTLALNSNYDLSFTGASLTITKRAVGVAANAQSKVYGEVDPALTYQITSGSLVNGDAFAGALSRAAGENVGIYAIHQGSLSLSGNYDLSFTGANLTITKRAVAVTADAQTKVYGDSDPPLTYQITTGSLVNGDTFAGALTRVAGENVGTHAIQQGTLALSGNYDLTFVGANLTINKRAVAVAADAQTKTYGEADPPLTYQVTGTLVFGDTFSGTLTRVAGENVGTYAIQQGSLALSGNYDLSFTGATFTVDPRAVAVKADAKSKTYGDGDPALTYQVTGTLVAGDSFSGALTRAAGEGVGAHAILQGTLALSSNYSLTFVGDSLTINARAVTVTAEAKSKTYGDPDPSLTYQVAGTLAFGDTFSGALTRAAGETVGAYAIQQGTLALSTNYALSFVGADLAIGKRTVVGHFTAASKTYDSTVSATILTRTLENVVPEDGLVLTGGTAVFEDKNAGASKLVSGTGFSLGGNDVANYTLASSTLTTNANIDRKPLVVSATGHNKVYDGTTDATVTLGDDRLSGDVLTTGYSAAAFADKNVGNGKPVSVSGIAVGGADSGNYAANTTAAAAASITPRAASVAADAKSKIYGSPNPPLTAVVAGTVSGDTLSFTLATAAVTLSGVGSYPITVTIGLNPNYSVSSSNSTLMVGKAMPAMVVTSTANPSTVNGPVKFTATVPSPTSGTPTGMVQFQVDGLNFGGPVALASGVAPSANTNILSVGTHTVTASYAGDPNFFGTAAALAGGQVVDNPTCFVCDTASSIPARFNRTNIPAGRFIWFNNVLRVRHVGHADNDREEDDRDEGDEDDNDENEVWEAITNGSKPVTIRFDNQTIRFTSGAVVYNLPVPNGQVTFSPTATTATTTFNASTNTWESVVPTSGLTGRLFASGLAYQVPVNFPGDIKPVTWTARITSDVAGLRVRWRWSAAVYSTFSANHNALGVKPVSDNRLSAYANRDRAGTPENFKQFLASGGRSYGHNHVGWRTRSATTLQCGVGFWSSYTQSNWAAKAKDNNSGTLLTANFGNVYGGGVTIGGPAGFKLTFTSADAIRAFLPAGGKAGVLQATATNATNSKAGVFAGQVLALQLNVDFSEVGVLPVGLATLRVVDGPLTGRSVQQVLDLANQVLGGDMAALADNGLSSVTQLNDIVTNINENYERGTVDRGFLWP